MSIQIGDKFKPKIGATYYSESFKTLSEVRGLSSSEFIVRSIRGLKNEVLRGRDNYGTVIQILAKDVNIIPQHSIIIDGKTINLSPESYKALKEQLS